MTDKQAEERLDGPHEGQGVADYRCNACGKIVQRDLGWKDWTPSYCKEKGRPARLYRVSCPKPKEQDVRIHV